MAFSPINYALMEERTSEIIVDVGNALIPKGTVTFEELIAVDKATGYLYNISNDFVSDERFRDGGNKNYAAGTNVYYTADGMWDCLASTIPVEEKTDIDFDHDW